MIVASVPLAAPVRAAPRCGISHVLVATVPAARVMRDRS
jgi:hypothetical protein